MLKRSSLTVKDLGAHAQTRSVGLGEGLEVGWPVGSLVGAYDVLQEKANPSQ